MTLQRRGESQGTRTVTAGRTTKEEREERNQAMLREMADLRFCVKHKCNLTDEEVRTMERLVRAGHAYGMPTYYMGYQRTTVYYLTRSGKEMMGVREA
jgi:hypothetical protein